LSSNYEALINGFEADWSEQQTAPNYGYLFDVSADRKWIVRCAHISATGTHSGNTDGDAERFEKNARQAVEEFQPAVKPIGYL